MTFVTYRSCSRVNNVVDMLRIRAESNNTCRSCFKKVVFKKRSFAAAVKEKNVLDRGLPARSETSCSNRLADSFWMRVREDVEMLNMEISK